MTSKKAQLGEPFALAHVCGWRATGHAHWLGQADRLCVFPKLRHKKRRRRNPVDHCRPELYVVWQMLWRCRISDVHHGRYHMREKGAFLAKIVAIPSFLASCLSFPTYRQFTSSRRNHEAMVGDSDGDILGGPYIWVLIVFTVMFLV
jgi:hypothetical protein